MILALQFYDGDAAAAMRLARLLTDLELTPRHDVGLLLICQPDTGWNTDILDTWKHCKGRFDCDLVRSEYGASGWANGSGQLWRGALSWCHKLWKGQPTWKIANTSIEPYKHESVFTFDGGDGVPLHNNWISLLLDHHQDTVELGKSISGMLNLDVPAHPHINGNMVLELSMWDDYPRIRNTPLEASLKEFWKCWDIWHALEILPNARPSSVIDNQWNHTQVSRSIMDESAQSSIWLHGYKDAGLHDIARERLMSHLNGVSTYPTIVFKEEHARFIAEWMAKQP